MRLLLDTPLRVWALAQPDRLDATTRAALEYPENEVLFSAASLWEIAIKAALGHPDCSCNPQQVLQAAPARSGGRRRSARPLSSEHRHNARYEVSRRR
ncbi:MAG: hypothetical protein JWP20_1703 [Roseomonas sp.]|nr:hypothetical protein [Roseomonas sp.]